MTQPQRGARQAPRSRRRVAGLSLIELMISITLGLMILSGVAFVFVNASQARNEIERTSRQIENGRYAVEVIADDLRMAGFYGELTVGGSAPATLTDQCSLTASDWALWTLLHVQGYDAGAGFNQTTCALQNHKAGTDIILVRRARGCVAGVSGCDAALGGKPYLQVSLCATETTTFKLGLEGATTFDLKQKDCANAAGKRQYYVHIYYISTDNGAGDLVPTLKRIELDGTSWSTTALVEGIEELNISYGVDSNSDGAPNAYFAAPGTLADWTNVTAVQLHLLARNLEKSPDYTDTKTYSLGINAAGTAVTVTPGGNYRRHVYSALVRLNNPAGRKDKP